MQLTARPRYCLEEITSLVSFLSSPQKAKRGLGMSLNHLHSVYLTDDGATVISDSLVASWTSRSNSKSESESEITIAAIMRSSACQRKEGRRSEPPSSTVYDCSTVSPHTCVGGTKQLFPVYFRYTSPGFNEGPKRFGVTKLSIYTNRLIH